MKQISLPLVIIILSFFPSVTKAANYYARANGEWNGIATWSLTGPTGFGCGCTPGPGDDVYIDGRDIYISSGNISVANIYIYESTTGNNSYLRVEGSSILNANNVYLDLYNNNALNIEFIVRNDAIVHVTNDILLNRPSANLEENRLRIRTEDNAELNVDHLMITNDGSVDTLTKEYLKIYNNSVINVNQDFDIVSNGGGDTRIVSSNQGSLNVGGDVNILMNGGTRFRYYLYNSVGSNHLMVGGSMYFTETVNSGGFYLEARTTSDISIQNDVVINGIGNINWYQYENTLAAIGGSLSITQNDPTNNSDLIIRLRNNSILDVGTDNGLLLNGCQINATNSRDVIVDLRNDAVFNIYGDFDLDFASGRYLRLYLNQSTVPSSAGTRWTIDGNLTINKTGGQHTEFYSYQTSLTSVGGDFVFNASTQQINRNTNFSFQDQGTLEVNGDCNLSQLSPYNSAFQIQMYEESKFRFYGNTKFLSNGSVNAYLTVQLNDSSLIECGISDSDLSKSLEIEQSTSTGSLFRLIGKSQLISYGDVLVKKNSGGDIEFHLGWLEAGSTASVSVYGDLIFDNIDNLNSILFQLEQSSNLFCYQNIDFTRLLSSNRSYINIEDNSTLNLGKEVLRNTSPVSYGRIESLDNGTFRFFGSTSSQTIPVPTGDGVDFISYQNITFDNTSGIYPELQMNSDITIPGTATFNTGIVDAQSFSLIIEDNATAVNANNLSFVEGLVRKLGDDSFAFPVGGGGYYLPISISAPANVTSSFSAEYINANSHSLYNHNSKDVSLDYLGNCDFWYLNRLIGVDAVSVELSWNATHCNVPNILADLRVSRWNGTQWKDHGNGGTTGSIGAGSVSSSGTISSFSPFVIAQVTNPLPITLTNFEAQVVDEIIAINWNTQSEINNDFFTLEKSTDGVNYGLFKTVPGNGNSNTPIEYSAVDDYPVYGKNYYRLSQTDYDGNTTQFSPVLVNYENDENGYHYDPLSGTIFCSGKLVNDEDLFISIYDINGKIVSQFKYVEQESLKSLPEGIYLVSVDDGSIMRNFKVVIH
ncbi:MAG: T9SS type A sorting domain-containing protein [Flavobacteriales bacterium]|nr:T9SS type A sorting domain-containing protein [Flavobacteriales bacterium]